MGVFDNWNPFRKVQKPAEKTPDEETPTLEPLESGTFEETPDKNFAVRWLNF